MSDKTDARAWFIVVGNNHGWGRAKTEKGAMSNMQRSGSGRATEWTIYRCTEDTFVNDMGGLTYPVRVAPEIVGSKYAARKGD